MNRYTVYIIPRAWKEIKDLPGNMRQRVKRAVEALAGNPRPSKSKALNVPDFGHELRRLRLDRWRIVYAVTDRDKAVGWMGCLGFDGPNGTYGTRIGKSANQQVSESVSQRTRRRF